MLRHACGFELTNEPMRPRAEGIGNGRKTYAGEVVFGDELMLLKLVCPDVPMTCTEPAPYGHFVVPPLCEMVAR